MNPILRWGGLVLGLAVLLAMPAVLTPYSLRVLVLALIGSTAVLGLLLAFGYTGLIHLGQAAFTGVGAYGSAILTTRLGFGFWTALPVSLLLGGLVATLLGAPLLRLRGHYLALATVGLNVTFEIICKNWTGLSGGDDGITGIPGVKVGSWAINSDQRYFYLAAGVLAVAVLVVLALRASRFGRAMIAVRDDELASAAAGVVVFRVKLLAFALSGVLGALSGSLYAHYAGYIAPTDFDTVRSITLLVMLIVGGETSVLGAVGGCILIGFAPEWLRFVGSAYLTVFGIAIILVLVLMPDGFIGLLRSMAGRLFGPATRPARG